MTNRTATNDAAPLTRANLRTPRAAAIAGILFSLLLITSLWLLRLSVPRDPLQISAWMERDAARVTFALNLVPFAGIAFMWFLGVLRDRLGAKEDKFFATVFLGSGLMFLGMLFVAASAVGSLVLSYTAAPDSRLDTSTLIFARQFAYDIMHIYAFKMAAVFMITTSTLALYTRFAARWIAILGYASAAIILIGSGFLDWLLFVFPFWVLVVSIYILSENLRKEPPAVTEHE
jgi:MFS family permease